MKKQPILREALDALQKHKNPPAATVGTAVIHYLDTGDEAILGMLQSMPREYALCSLVEAVKDSDEPESTRVLELVVLAMNLGDTAFPVVRDPHGNSAAGSSGNAQSAIEDFVANFLYFYVGKADECHQRLIDAINRSEVPRSRAAATLLGARTRLFRFGWSTYDATSYFGCGLNNTHQLESPPKSLEGLGDLEKFIWALDDDEMVKLLSSSMDFKGAGRLHGALAALRPRVIEDFISEAPADAGAVLDWRYVLPTTADFDRFFLSKPQPEAERHSLGLLVLMDSLRPETCSAEALSTALQDENIPDESGLSYVQDHHPERLAEYLKLALAKPEELAELTCHTLQKSWQIVAKQWSQGGKEVAMKLAESPWVPTPTYSEGKASLHGWALEGLVSGDSIPPPEDLQQYLSLSEKSLGSSRLDSKSKLESRRYLYLALVASYPHVFVREFWNLLEESSKMLRDLAVDGLAKVGGPEVVKRAISLLSSRKADVRSSAVDLLARFTDSEASEALEVALTTENSDKVRASLHRALGGASPQPAQKTAIAPGKQDLQEMLEELNRNAVKLKLPKSGLRNLSDLPGLPTSDCKDLPEPAITFLIAKQSKHKPLDAAPDILPLLAHIDRDKSAPFALALVEGFLNSEQAASDRWALALGGLLGDNRIIPPLLSRIQGWCENSRHKLAEYAAQTIALLPGDEPLMVLDTLANRYRSKFKNVGKACAEAFQAAAAARGITADELGDLVVPTFDFNEDGIRRFEWEEGGISAELGPNFKLTWSDPETDKTWKTLPAAAPEEIKLEVKTLTKLLRETVKGQTMRLEMALVRQRRWPVARWRELYENHPLLRSFASGLVWGIYDESSSLLRTFRRYSNGLLADAAGELEELPETDTMIGMIHPLELDQAALDAWAAHLGRLKVKQPFPQIGRPVEIMDSLHGNRREIQISKDKEVSAGTFRSRAEKRGWARGSVVDAGGISSYYKLYPGARIEVILPTADFWVGMEPMEPVQLEAAYFVNAGTVERGSYLYDEPAADDPRVLRFDQVPAVVWSETVSDLKAIVGS